MKQFFTLILCLCALCAHAQTFDWITTLSATETSKAQTNIQYVAYYSDSSALVFGNYGSLYATDFGVLGDEQYPGADYGTASGYNKNFILAKLDKSGSVLWAVHSEDGDVNDSQSAVTLTADGGAVLALKFRHSDHNKQNGVASPLYKIVDEAGLSFSREMEYPGEWVNQPVLVRVDKEGKVTAVKDLWVSTEKAAKGDKDITTDAFTFSAAVEDKNGNIYIAGSQSLDMKIDDVTISARPQPNWDGTTTDARYNGFVLKLDADLGYLAHITGEGTIQNDKPFCVAYRKGKLYFSGLAKAEEGTANLSLGDKTAEVKELSVVNACLNTDLTVNWLTATPIVRYNNKQGNLLYQSLLSHDGNSLYLTGGIQGAIELGGQTIHSGGEANSTMNDGYVFAYNTADGTLAHAAVFGSTTLNLNHGAVDLGDSLYVYNYQFGDIRQVAYDKQLTQGSVRTLATGGGASTIVYTAARNGQIMLALRSKGAADFKVFDQTVNLPTLWFNTFVAFHMDYNVPSDVADITLPTTTTTKLLRDGQILIIRDGHSYNALGFPASIAK